MHRNSDIQRADAMNEALDILIQYGNKIQQPKKNVCVIFDIDDTLIDSHTEMVIEPMRVLYQKVLDMGIPIFIVTARDPSGGEYTTDQLRSLGLNGYHSLFLVGHNPAEHGRDRGIRKANIRRKLKERGYHILLNIGDDTSDFEGGHFMYGVKLPYMY